MLLQSDDTRSRRPERILLLILYVSIAAIAVVTFFLLQRTPLTPFQEGCIVGAFLTIGILLPMNFYLLREQMQKTEIQQALKKMQEKYSRAVASTRDGIFEWDIKSNRRYWSPRLKEMIGYSETELNDPMESYSHLIHHDDIQVHEQALRDHFSGAQPEFSSIFRWHHKDGHWVWINARGKATFDEKGAPMTLTGICTDITTLKQYEQQLEQSRQQADKENQAKSEFLAHMSHEIRTPLTAITGASEILYSRKHDFDEKTGRLLGALNASAQSLKDLLGGILDFSKIESGQMKLEERPFPLADVFSDIYESMSLRATEKNLALVFNYDDVDGVVFTGDRIRFKQIVTNLVGNAIKFTERGSVTLTAARKSTADKTALVITVQDTGIGIRSGDTEAIFNRYVQGDSSISRKYGGTGLGLPIAKQLAILMNGSITVDSVSGEGSVFTVTLPLSSAQAVPLPVATDDDTDAQPSAVIARQNFDASVLRQNSTILIVEDYEDTITIIAEMLSSIGFKYDVARTGLEALNKWNENAYKLVLMDIQLPEMDGLTAMTQIRNIEQERSQKRTPVIAMTAHAFIEDKSKYLEAGFDAYIPKPISRDDLIAKIFSSLQAVETMHKAM